MRERISKYLPWILISAGAVLRIAQFLFNRSLTEGEAPLAMNIIERSYAGLLKPLDYVQAAPVGFLWIQKFMVSALGNNELAFRTAPLIAGLAALVIFYLIARKMLHGPAIMIGLTLFAVNDHLIYFTSELKQYSFDVATVLVLILLALWLMETYFDPSIFVGFGLASALSIWLSHPSLFVGAALYFTMLVEIIGKKRHDRLPWLVAALALYGLSITLNYLTSLSALSRHSAFLDFWQRSFFPLLPGSWSDVKQMVFLSLKVFKNPGGFSPYEALLAAAGLVAGIIMFYKRNKRFSAILILPIILTLLASGLHKYPFEGRLLLFIVPLMIILIASGIEHLRRIIEKGSPCLGWLMIAALLFLPAGSAAYRLLVPRAPEELRTLLVQMQSRRRQELDTYYVYCGAVNAFRYYAPKFGYPAGSYIEGIEARADWAKYYADLSRLKGRKSVWIVMSHIARWSGVDEELLFASYLDLLGKRIAVLKTPGAAAFLYDLTE